MKLFRTQLLLPLLSLLLLTIIVTDTFVLRPVIETRILRNKDIEFGYARVRTILHYKLVDNKNVTYEVSYRTFSDLEVGDSFLISKSFLFGKALSITYSSKGVNHIEDIDLGFAIIILIMIVLFALLTLILPFFLNTRRINRDLLIMTAFLDVAFLVYYFFWQS